MKKFILIVLLFFSASSLSAIDYRDGYIDDEYKGSKLGKVVVLYPDIALSMERFFEEGFTNLLNEYEHINATNYLDQISPIYKLSNEKITSKLVAAGYEQLFLITNLKNKRENIIAQGPLFNNLYSMADVAIKVEIYDLKNNKKLMWVGDVSIARDIDIPGVRNYVRKQIVYLLKKDGLIKVNE